jgi:DNA-binding NarL/FixJ family response regulator
MAQTPHMRVVWQMRRAILEGASVKDIALATHCSEATVRAYTKAERAKVKEYKRDAKLQAEHQQLMRMAHLG